MTFSAVHVSWCCKLCASQPILLFCCSPFTCLWFPTLRQPWKPPINIVPNRSVVRYHQLISISFKNGWDEVPCWFAKRIKLPDIIAIAVFCQGQMDGAGRCRVIDRKYTLEWSSVLCQRGISLSNSINPKEGSGRLARTSEQRTTCWTTLALTYVLHPGLQLWDWLRILEWGKLSRQRS